MIKTVEVSAHITNKTKQKKGYKMTYMRLIISSILLSSIFNTAQAIPADQITQRFHISNYAQTKYPIVFNHGMAGFARLGTDVAGVDYWYQVLPNLAKNGANVWATRVSPLNSSEVRGEQLIQQVEQIIAITGKPKVNLIGHSHGGPTIRYVAGIRPDLVASLTTISAPHKGSPVADAVLTVQNTALETPVVTLMNTLSRIITLVQGFKPSQLPHDSLAAGISLSTTGSVEFNKKFPLGMPTTSCGEGAYQQNGIYFYSFSGVGQVTNLIDLDSALGITGLLINKGQDNDGLVSRCSAKFGKTIRDNLNWNHLDEVNQFLGLKAIFAPDPVDVYRQHANRLKLQGL